jgi:hypothetical protein
MPNDTLDWAKPFVKQGEPTPSGWGNLVSVNDTTPPPPKPIPPAPPEKLMHKHAYSTASYKLAKAERGK